PFGWTAAAGAVVGDVEHQFTGALRDADAHAARSPVLQCVAQGLAHDAEQMQRLATVQLRVGQLVRLLPVERATSQAQTLFGLVADLLQGLDQRARRAARARDYVAQVLQDRTRDVGMRGGRARVDQA